MTEQLSRKDVSDLFRWLVIEGSLWSLSDEDVERIQSLIEHPEACWSEEWKAFQAATKPKCGIGTEPSFQG